MNKTLKTVYVLSLMVFISSCANSQDKKIDNPKLVGGPCEGCEAIFEYGDKKMSSVDTLPDYDEEGIKIRITGTVYQPDGKSPAEDVIVYIYHTNQDGIYENKYDEKSWARRHGYIRGWVKTDANGIYEFYTLKPGVYPSGSEPAHIHITILEPDGRYYWLNSYHFAGDPLLTDKETNQKSPRGGSVGLLSLKKVEGDMTGTRNIVLGKNIPGYSE